MHIRWVAIIMVACFYLMTMPLFWAMSNTMPHAGKSTPFKGKELSPTKDVEADLESAFEGYTEESE